MRQLALILNFILFFNTSLSLAFAATDSKLCKRNKKEITKIDKHLGEINKLEEKFESYMHMQQASELLQNIQTDKKKSISTDNDYKLLGYFFDSCKELSDKIAESSSELEEDSDLISSCLSDVDKMTNEESGETYKIKRADHGKLLADNEKRIIAIKETPTFINLSKLKKHLALELLESDCKLSLEDKKEYNSISCGKFVLGAGNKQIDKHFKNNMDIINKLNIGLNKIPKEELVESCKFIKGVGAKPGDYMAVKYNNINACDELVTIKTKEEVNIIKKVIRTKKKEARKKKQQSYGDDDDDDDVYERNANKTRTRLTPKSKISNKFWKTAGIVTAAIGVSGLVGWGLYSMFNSTQSSYTPAVYVPPTTPMTYNNYAMDPYEAYKYQQYMMGGYQQNLYDQTGTNYYQGGSAYTFEFGN